MCTVCDVVPCHLIQKEILCIFICIMITEYFVLCLVFFWQFFYFVSLVLVNTHTIDFFTVVRSNSTISSSDIVQNLFFNKFTLLTKII